MAASLPSHSRKFGASEFEIRPGLAFFTRTAQQVRRMIRHDQRRPVRAETMHLPAQTPDGCLGRQQILRRDSADSENQAWLNQIDLPL